MDQLVSWLSSRFSTRTIVDGLAIISGITGIVGFIRDSFRGDEINWPWLFIAIAGIVFVYRVLANQTSIDLTQLFRRTISIEQALGHLAWETGSSRVAIIRNIEPLLKNNISGLDAAKLLGDLVISDRVEAIRILAPKILAPDQDGIKAVLGSLVMSDREEATYYLAHRTSRKIDDR